MFSRKFTSVQTEENCQITSENADLHFIDYLVVPLPYLLQCFDKRKSHQKDTWLIYIGTQTKEEVLKEDKNAEDGYTKDWRYVLGLPPWFLKN